MNKKNNEKVHNVNILSEDLLPTAWEIMARLPMEQAVEDFVWAARLRIIDILERRSPRMLAVIGPCSIHDPGEALEYAGKLMALREKVDDCIEVVMRVYLEKPRTTIGWKGFINDPRRDDSFQIGEGLCRSRDFLLKLARMGLPAGTEALDPVPPQYIGDLIAWTAIGARTTESQTHREMASGLSTSVGFKNSTDGNIATAINALLTTAHPHHFLGVTRDGRSAVFHTAGNQYGHVILRGGPVSNYDAESVAACEQMLAAAGLPLNIMIDCSHDNSGRVPVRQVDVLRDIMEQKQNGNRSIFGFMLESYLHEGRQDPGPAGTELRPGVSITDPCLDWERTESAVLEAAEVLRKQGH